MEKIILDEKYFLEYIKDMISSFKIKSVEISNAIYHHNINYKNAPLALTHGILSISEQNKLGIKKYSSKILNIFSDINSHANDIDKISLSVVGLKDLYKDEYEYNPFDPLKVDLNISSNICARRSTLNYGIEFLCYKNIEVDKIKSVDIRLLELIKKRKDISISDIIDKYNCLKDIALTMKKQNLEIPFREMSSNNFALDIDKASNIPKLILKQNK